MQLDIKIVGRAVFNREVVQDDIDTGLDGNVVFTPALTRRLSQCCASFTWSALRLDGHAQSVAVVEREIEDALPKDVPVIFDVASLTAAKAERAIEPESIALAVFGGIAGIAALLIAASVGVVATDGRTVSAGRRIKRVRGHESAASERRARRHDCDRGSLIGASSFRNARPDR